MLDEWNSYLVSFDTDRIKEYLFATNRLKEIRGASAILVELDKNRESELKGLGADVVYSAGGGASALVEKPEQAKQIIFNLEKKFREATHTASITGISLEPEKQTDPQQKQSFGRRMREAGENLRRVKSRKADLVFLPTEPYFRLCDSCGQYPASKRAKDDGDLLCISCFTKREEGHEDKAAQYRRFMKKANEEAEKIWDIRNLPKDLNAIGEVSRPPNYIGFIAIDGNDMGSLLEKLPRKSTYGEYSDGLQHLVRDLTYSALAKHGKPRREVAPFEIVLIGGDDLMLFTAADIAIPVAQQILQEFEDQSPELLRRVGLASERKKLTMSAGVVLAHANYPIPALHTMAEQLLKSAKRLAAQTKYAVGAIDFQAVTSSAMELSSARQGVPHRRPYTRDELERLLHHIRQLKAVDFSTSALQAIYQALFETSHNQSTLTTLRIIARAEKEKRLALLEFMHDFTKLEEKEVPYPWTSLDVPRRAALLDLVELYPFIK
ncbi:MAG: hypothetical protein ONB46_08505 [candidate division KSB1 bacterium]|nr:hypothetical protein [candidate division KSB1 bacterium]MDZ7365936.1 hypothetical protein [candidate division KSB1 bacterium]MDZ7403830.1 hypothetical protein [candidate division KSB1 bacterium]